MADNTPSHKMKIQCPVCGVKLDVSELEPFSQVSCPKCGTNITIPKWFLGNILLEERFFDSAQKTLYRSLEPSLDREAMVKIAKQGPYSEEELNAFLECARKQATINSPCIASIYSCGMTDEGAYVISQYHSSVDWPCAEFQDVKVLLEVATSLVNAVDEAAKAGLHHGGLCPANILINNERDLLVTDFGTAVALGKKPGFFAAPEHKPGSPATLEGDVYSMGACLYYMGTGVIPERGATQPIGTLKKGLPPAAAEAIMKMLSPEPSQRPTDLAELAKAFNGGAANAPKAGGKKQLKRSGAVHVKVVQPPKSQGSALNKVLAIACVLAVVIGGVYLFKSNGGSAKGKTVKPAASEASQVAVAPAKPAEPQPYTLPPECLAARPRPEDLDFRPLKSQNQAYLKMVPDEKRDTEKERLRLVGSSLDYLKACMKAGAYNRGDSHPIRMKDGSVIQGIIPYAPNKEKQLTIRRPGNQEPVKVDMAKLDFMQLMDIFQFYAEKREEMALGKLTRSIKDEIFAIYQRMALLCDWYGHPEAARKFTRLALKYRPTMEQELWDLGLEPDEEPQK